MSVGIWAKQLSEKNNAKFNHWSYIKEPMLFCGFPTVLLCVGREYWMIYRGTGFLAVVWFGSSPTPSPSPVRKLSLFLSLPVCFANRAYTVGTGVEGGGRGAKSYDGKKAWSSINHSKLSGFLSPPLHPGAAKTGRNKQNTPLFSLG